MFQIGQFVYTNREIRGWFNYSVKAAIPANLRGKIVGIAVSSDNIESVVYEVEFDREFGRYNINHTSLKLG